MTSSMIGDAGRRNCAHTGIATFLRSNYVDDLQKLSAKWAVFGVPFDEGSPYAPGARFGPRSIREHSLRFRGTGVFDSLERRSLIQNIVPEGRIVDVGDADIYPGCPARSFENVTALTRAIRAAGARPIAIGGDHSITFPIVRAFDERIHVIQLDAHLDYMPTDGDFQFSNGQGFRKIHALPQVESLTQIGIRGLRNGPMDFCDAEANGSHIVDMRQFRAQGPEAALEHLPDGAHCYVSIDIDAYDMMLVPGCVSAEADGLMFAEMMALLTCIGSRFEVLGFDLVEVCPPLDVGTHITSYLAAETMVRFLGMLEQ